jgi:hypothetical protein
MTFTKHFPREAVEQRIVAANRQKIPMFLKTTNYPAEYHQVDHVKLSENGFKGKRTDVPPWHSDVVGTELVFAHEHIRFNDFPFECNEITPPEIVLQCQQYVESLPTTVSGRKETAQIRHVAEVIFHDFALDDTSGWIALLEYNTRCHPCWSVTELRRFMNQVAYNPPKNRMRGALRNKSFIVQTFSNED